MRIRIKNIREAFKNLPDEALFEIEISDGKCGKRSVSTDIINLSEIEFGTWVDTNNNKKKIGYINIVCPDVARGNNG